MNTILIQDTLCYLNDVNSRILNTPTILLDCGEANLFAQKLETVSRNIEKELPYFSNRINFLRSILFVNNRGYCGINPFVFGQVYEIFAALNNINNSNIDRWSLIHPRISNAAKSLYLDGHYANAAEDAFIAINERVKGLFQIIRPSDKVPDGDTAMTTVFSTNNPLIEFCDTSSETGKNIQKGFMQMLSGSMSALRNPKAHANIKLSADDAMRQLMFASMLMFKIDEAVAYSNIQEK
ncbi:MAG: TIGR02391 family protein [Oscillospiraceae bacterium]|nr:TIGR02391 family protein [Oscillospiraceae bacterium]